MIRIIWLIFSTHTTHDIDEEMRNEKRGTRTGVMIRASGLWGMEIYVEEREYMELVQRR